MILENNDTRLVCDLTDEELVILCYRRNLWPPAILGTLTIGVGDDALTLHYNERVISWHGRLHYLTISMWQAFTLLAERYPHGATTRDLAWAFRPGLERPIAAGHLRTYLYYLRLLIPGVIRSTPCVGAPETIYSLDLSARDAYDTPRRRAYYARGRTWRLGMVETALGPADALIHRT